MKHRYHLVRYNWVESLCRCITKMEQRLWGDLYCSTHKAFSTVEENCRYMEKYHNRSNSVHTCEPDWSQKKATNVDWTYTCCDEVTDDIAADIPRPLGNPVAQTLLCRCEPAQRRYMGRSVTGNYLLNFIWIDFTSKQHRSNGYLLDENSIRHESRQTK